MDGYVLQELPSLGPEQAFQPSPYVLSVRRHPPVWVIYGGELWGRVRALLAAAPQKGLPRCKHKSGRKPGGNTHILSSLGRTIQEDKPSCRRKCCLEMSHACTRRELQNSSLSQCQDGPVPPAAPTLLFSRSSHSMAGMEQLSLQLHSPPPEARRSQFASASAQPSSDTGTPSLKPRPGAMCNTVTPAEHCWSQRGRVQRWFELQGSVYH